jgi:hypothetical protein
MEAYIIIFKPQTEKEGNLNFRERLELVTTESLDERRSMDKRFRREINNYFHLYSNYYSLREEILSFMGRISSGGNFQVLNLFSRLILHIILSLIAEIENLSRAPTVAWPKYS